MSKQINNLPKRTPYGVADYGRLRRKNAYYVNKTHYVMDGYIRSAFDDGDVFK